MTDARSGRGLTAGGYYFAHKNNVSTDSLRLLPDEARHATKVLRLGPGDEIAVVDGEGGWYHARIDAIDRDGLIASILERRDNVGEPAYGLTIAIGLLKQQNRFETFLEKAVELGVTRIIPTITERVQSNGLNMKRCHRILVAGLKQSLRSRIPQLVEPRPFHSIIRERADVRLLAHEGAESEESIMVHLEKLKAADSCFVLIGPEGGFSDTEVERARRAGWWRVSLGHARLRSETAGITAASMIQLIKSMPE